MFSYVAFLWAVPIVMTLDYDVDARKAFSASEWLRANILLDVLPPGATCYFPGERSRISMSDVSMASIKKVI